MCGRTALGLDPALLVQHYQRVFHNRNVVVAFADANRFTPSYNCAPGQLHPVLVLHQSKDGQRIVLEFQCMKWGLIPSWTKSVDSSTLKPINARADSIMEKPMFRNLVSRQRCLVPAQGFYEWKAIKGEKNKQPYFISPKVAKAEDGENIKPISDPPLWEFAGLFDTWYDPENLGEKIYTFTLITTEPSEQFASIHNRMPVIIRPTDRWKWLDPHTSVDEALKLLQPYPELIDIRPVSRLVSSFRNTGRELIEPIELHQTRPLTDFFSSPKKATGNLKNEAQVKQDFQKTASQKAETSVKSENDKSDRKAPPDVKKKVLDDNEIESVSSDDAEKKAPIFLPPQRTSRHGASFTKSFSLEPAPDMNVIVKGEKVVRSPVKSKKGSLDAFITTNKGKVTVKEIKSDPSVGVGITDESIAKITVESASQGMKRAREDEDSISRRMRQKKEDY